MGNIRLKSNNRDTLVSIVNWRHFQAEDPSETPSPEQPANNQRTTDEQQTNTIDTKNGRMEEGNPLPPSKENPSDEIGWLVREWFHVYRGGRKTDLHLEVADGFRELIRLGWTADTIKLAITDRARVKTEWPSTFFARLNKEKGRGSIPESPDEKKTRLAKAAARNAEIMRKYGRTENLSVFPPADPEAPQS
jgi:hypothetical protein